MNDVGLGAVLAARRLRGRFLLLSGTAALAFVAVASILERRASPWHAADHALLGAAAGVALPLFAYAAVGCATGAHRLDDSVDEIGRYGANRRLCVLGLLGTTALATGLVGAALGAVAVIVARSSSDPALIGDAATSMWVAALGGACYVTAFGLGAGLGRRGGGRFVVLASDWVLGSTTSAAALPLPRSHLRNLLGAEPVMDMPQWQASAVLVVLVVAYAAIALWKTPR